MISEAMFRSALKDAGAHKVSKAALTKFQAWMLTLMNDEARNRRQNDAGRRVTVLADDIGE